MNLLVNNFLDGRRACYLVYLSSNELLLVDDQGDAGGPFSRMFLDGSTNKIQNSQCSVSALSGFSFGTKVGEDLDVVTAASYV